MKRRFGLGLVMALCVLVVAASAWATPLMPVSFTTNTAVNAGAKIGTYAVSFDSVNHTGSTTAFPLLLDDVNHGIFWNAKNNPATPVDFLLIYANTATKSQKFSADSTPAGITAWLEGFPYNTSEWYLHSGDLSGAIGPVAVSIDAPRLFTMEWKCPACGENDCNMLQFNTLSGDFRALNSAVDSLDVQVYIPCGTYEKRWQVMPSNAVCEALDMVNTAYYPISYDRYVHFADMVLYSTNVAGSHTLDMGPYVVDGTNYVETYSATQDNRGVWGNNWYRGDWVVERVLNKSAHRVDALMNRFHWELVPEGAADATGFTKRLMVNDGEVAAAAGTVFSYLMNQDNAASHNLGTATAWYSFAVDQNDPYDLAPGFATYFARRGENFVTGKGALQTDIEMTFDVSATSTNDFCQTTLLNAKRWGVGPWCYDWDCDNDPYCARVERRWVDDNVLAEVKDVLGLTYDKMGVYWKDAEVRKVTGRKEAITDICGAADPCHTMCYYQYVQEGVEACKPADATLCRTVSVDLGAHWSTTCDISEFDGKTFIQPVKVTFEIAPAHICDKDAKADITAAVAGIAADNTWINKGPIDAFMAAGNEKRLTFGVYGYDGNWYNLGYLADAFFSSSDKTAKPWLGMKNFFEVWPNETADLTKSVKAIWAEGSNKLDFSFYAVLVSGKAPQGKAVVQAKDGYFVIYTGDLEDIDACNRDRVNPWPTGVVAPVAAPEINNTRLQATFGAFTGFAEEMLPCTPVTPTPSVTPTTAPVTPTTAPVTPTTAPVTPTTAPSGSSSSGGGCNVGLAPLALVLLAPLALFLKK